MNRPLFQRNFEILNSVLDSLKQLMGDKELKYRKDKILNVYNEMMSVNSIHDKYYSMAHEIRAIEMFNLMGDTSVAKDSNNDPGVDLFFKEILVECVISTTGQDKNYSSLIKSGYQEYNKIIDYNEKFRQISLRILSSLTTKREKYLKDVKKRVIDSNKPFCIFINLGSLAQEWFPGELCNEATRFLLGRGHPRIRIDKNTAKQIGGISYEYTPYVENNNHSIVCTNFFGDLANSCVTAVIITTAELNEKYSPDNTFVFTNPFAVNKIKVKDFMKYPYWKANKKNEYVPRICGKQINISW